MRINALSHYVSSAMWLCSLESVISQVAAFETMMQAMLSPKEFKVDAIATIGEQEEYFGNYKDMVQVVGNVAIVSVKGSLVTTGYGRIGRYFGLVGYDEIVNALTLATNHPDVNSSLLLVSSGGGSALGINTASDTITKLDQIKPIYGHSDTVSASGGYWLLSSTRSISISNMAELGSIGVITTHMDYTKYLEDMGLKATIVRSGEDKALGQPYEKMTETIKARWQERSDKIHDFFKDHVTSHRPILKADRLEVLGGKTFFGQDAVGLGLADSVAGLDAIVAELQNRHNSGKSASATGSINVKRKLNASGIAAVEAGMSKEAALRTEGLFELCDDQEEGQVSQPEGGAEVSGGAAGDKGDDNGDENPEGKAADVSADVEQPVTPPAAVDAGAVAALAGQIADLSSKVATKDAEILLKGNEITSLNDKITQLTAAAEVSAGEISQLREIVCQSVNRLQVAVGGHAIDLKEMSTKAVVDMYGQLQTQMQTKFPVGGAASNGGKEAPAAISFADQRRDQAAGLKVTN